MDLVRKCEETVSVLGKAKVVPVRN